MTAIAFALALAAAVLATLVGLPLAQMALSRRAHVEFERYNNEKFGEWTYLLDAELEHEWYRKLELEAMNRLAQELVYDEGLESPLDAPMLNCGPLFAPLAANSNSVAPASNG